MARAQPEETVDEGFYADGTATSPTVVSPTVDFFLILVATLAAASALTVLL